MTCWAVRVDGFGGGSEVFGSQGQAVEHYARALRMHTANARLYRVYFDGSLDDRDTMDAVRRALESMPEDVPATVTPAPGIIVVPVLDAGMP